MQDKSQKKNSEPHIEKKQQIPGYDSDLFLDGPLNDIYGCAANLSLIADAMIEIEPTAEAALNLVSNTLQTALSDLEGSLFLDRSLS